MLEAPLRQAAAALLEMAVRIAPPEVRDWGRAMLSELGHVESGWAAVAWALGGAGVLAKHALICLLIPARRGQSVPPGAGLFAKDVSVRKAALAAGGVCVLAALVFFAAPPFRQGLRVSLGAWKVLFPVTEPRGQPEVESFAKRAEARHDPEGLVFVAVRLRDAGESARLGEEAVRIDPTLVWAYAVVAARHPELPEVRQWIPELERSEPQNALFPLIAAESIGAHHFANASKLSPNKLQAEVLRDPAWRAAMAAAFASPKFDDYVDRLSELDQDVVRRYHLNDPYMALYGKGGALPIFALSDNARKFAMSLVQSGEKLEARGDRHGAAERYWTVARFGQVIDSQAHTDSGHMMGVALQDMAYKQLQALAPSEGNFHEAALFSYLLKRTSTFARETHREQLFGRYVTTRNAVVLQVSGLAMLFFSALLIAVLLALIAGNRNAGRSRRSQSGITVVALTSGVGALLSSATVYLTYRPYWYIFQGVIESGDEGQRRDLLNFLTDMRFLPAPRGFHLFWPHFAVYFWAGVISVGAAALLLILLRRFTEHKGSREIHTDPRTT